jgi:hypothetical protein
MGRPIKKKYFVNGGSDDASSVVKYKGVTLSINANGTHYSKGATAAISAPDWSDGVNATASLTIAAPGSGGGITAATIVNPGEGYLTAPTVTIVKPATVTSTVNGTGPVTATNTFTVGSTVGINVGMLISGALTGSNGYVTAINGNVITSSVNNSGTWTNQTNLTFSDNGSGATFTVGLTAVEADTGTIACTAYLTTGSSAVKSAIIKQEGSHRYFVENDQGRGTCLLATTSTLTAGQMTIIANDTNGSTYYVKKLTSRKAVIYQKTVNGSFLFNDEAVVGWTTGAPSTGIVQIVTN